MCLLPLPPSTFIICCVDTTAVPDLPDTMPCQEIVANIVVRKFMQVCRGDRYLYPKPLTILGQAQIYYKRPRIIPDL